MTLVIIVHRSWCRTFGADGGGLAGLAGWVLVGTFSVCLVWVPLDVDGFALSSLPRYSTPTLNLARAHETL